MKNILIKMALLLPIFVLVNCSGGDSTEIDPDLDVTYICVDTDGDGFTVSDEENGSVDCSVVEDCDDEDAEIFPGAIEYPDDDVDQDCDDSDYDSDNDIEDEGDDEDSSDDDSTDDEESTDTTTDSDDDGVDDDTDNCDTTENADQADTDADGIGDACDDSDSDSIYDDVDNCTTTSNTDQSDVDSDGLGDLCDTETCSLDDGDLDDDGDGATGCADSDCATLCAEYSDDDGDGLVNLIDPQDEVVNTWGYIDAENATSSDCVNEVPEFSYSYVEGTDVSCDTDADEDCNNYAEVDGATFESYDLTSQPCVGDSATESFDYGIYIVQDDDDADGLSNAADPDNDTANLWWTINTDSSTSKTFLRGVYSYTFIEGTFCDDECWLFEVFSGGTASDSGIFVEVTSSDTYGIYGVTDWSLSQGEVSSDLIGEYGVYVRGESLLSVPRTGL